MLGAAEVFFAQYVTDIRTQANPAGIVGACTAMHAELKRSAMYTDELKPLQGFVQDIKTQYQTSLGLGGSFLNDKAGGARRRTRDARYSRGRFGRRDSSRIGGVGGRGSQQLSRGNFSAGNFYDSNFGQATPAQSGERRVCYDFQAGACRRGGLCRFFHPQ